MGGRKSKLSKEQKQELKTQAANSRKIDESMAKANKEQSRVIKMLILGAGESGKSTFLKQMITLYGVGFNEESRKKYKKDIHSNAIESIRTLCTFSDLLPAELNTRVSAPNVQYKEFFKNPDSCSNGVVTAEVADYVKKLWADPGIQSCYEHRARFQLPDSAAYFFSRIDALAAADYVPDYDDVLRTRVRTTGVVKTNFLIGNHNFEVYDVGGQKSERRKWIHCFDNVTAVIFVAAISEYNQTMFEDGTTNRLLEAIQLFSEVCNSLYFEKTSMILFLNKTDLFEAKIPKVPLSVCFPQISPQEAQNVQACKEFIKLEFVLKNQATNRQVYPHFTTVTDKDNVKRVFEAAKDIILKLSLRGGGIMV